MASVEVTNILLSALVALSAARTGVYLYEAYLRWRESKRVVKSKQDGWKF